MGGVGGGWAVVIHLRCPHPEGEEGQGGGGGSASGARQTPPPSTAARAPEDPGCNRYSTFAGAGETNNKTCDMQAAALKSSTHAVCSTEIARIPLVYAPQCRSLRRMLVRSR